MTPYSSSLNNVINGNVVILYSRLQSHVTLLQELLQLLLPEEVIHLLEADHMSPLLHERVHVVRQPLQEGPHLLVARLVERLVGADVVCHHADSVGKP